MRRRNAEITAARGRCVADRHPDPHVIAQLTRAELAAVLRAGGLLSATTAAHDIDHVAIRIAARAALGARERG